MADITKYKPFYSVLVLAFACSALVAGAAVGLRPKQQANQLLDQQKNVLVAAGLYSEDKPVAELFENIETRIVDLEKGLFVTEVQDDSRTAIPGDKDSAGIRIRENFSQVYLVKENDQFSQLVLPVRGKGLWSTMYAYVAVGSDLNTINGVSFYQHGETPGLGGEIENKSWQQGWVGKQIYRDDDSYALAVVKKKSSDSDAELYEIDGIAGATLTSDGVDGMLEYWFGDHAFKNFLSWLKTQEKGTSNG